MYLFPQLKIIKVFTRSTISIQSILNQKKIKKEKHFSNFLESFISLLLSRLRYSLGLLLSLETLVFPREHTFYAMSMLDVSTHVALLPIYAERSIRSKVIPRDALYSYCYSNNKTNVIFIYLTFKQIQTLIKILF